MTVKKSTLYEITLTCICVLTFIMSSFPKLPLVTTILSFFLFFLVSILVKYLISKETMLTDHISVTAERKRIRLVFITLINLTLVMVSMEPYILSKYKLYTPGFYKLNNNLGYAACIVLGLSFIILPIYKLLKVNVFKKLTRFLAKQARKWHIPLSLLGIGFVFYHTYLSLINGFKTSYTYLTGYAALFELLLLSVIGLLRFKKIDQGKHKLLSYIFILFVVLHIICSEYRL